MRASYLLNRARERFEDAALHVRDFVVDDIPRAAGNAAEAVTDFADDAACAASSLLDDGAFRVRRYVERRPDLQFSLRPLTCYATMLIDAFDAFRSALSTTVEIQLASNEHARWYSTTGWIYEVGSDIPMSTAIFNAGPMSDDIRRSFESDKGDSVTLRLQRFGLLDITVAPADGEPRSAQFTLMLNEWVRIVGPHDVEIHVVRYRTEDSSPSDPYPRFTRGPGRARMLRTLDLL